MNKEIKMPKWLETTIAIIIVTVATWLSYYPIWLVNKIGLLLRGPIVYTEQPGSPFDYWMNDVSSLGFLFVTITLIFLLYEMSGDDEEKK